MKKIILTVIAVCAFGFANAQNAEFGVKGGVNFSSYTGDSEGTEGKVSFQVGAFTAFNLSEKFVIQPEVLYTRLGAKAEDSGFKITNSLDYIVVPVMARYYVANQFSLEVGPQVGFLIAAEAEAEGVSVDVKELFENTDFGINFGAGYDFSEKFFTGVRYTLGVSNIIKDSGNESLQNSNLAVTLGYKF